MLIWQGQIRNWMFNMVKAPDQWDPVNRGQRILEEVAEACQCPEIGLSEQQCHDIITYVYNRPTGVYHQEIGGIIVTLLALCDATKEDLYQCMVDEIARIREPEMVEKVRNAIIRKRNDGVGI